MKTGSNNYYAVPNMTGVFCFGAMQNPRLQFRLAQGAKTVRKAVEVNGALVQNKGDDFLYYDERLGVFPETLPSDDPLGRNAETDTTEYRTPGRGCLSVRANYDPFSPNMDRIGQMQESLLALDVLASNELYTFSGISPVIPQIETTAARLARLVGYSQAKAVTRSQASQVFSLMKQAGANQPSDLRKYAVVNRANCPYPLQHYMLSQGTPEQESIFGAQIAIDTASALPTFGASLGALDPSSFYTAPGALDVEQLEVTVWYEVWRNMTTRTTTDGRRTWTATR